MSKQVRHSFKGVFWFISSLLVSTLNDLLTKYLITFFPKWEVVFFRFFFGMFTVLPVLLFKKRSLLYTQHLSLHFFRSFILVLGIYCWILGLESNLISMATLISFTIPIFVLMFASFCLQEKTDVKIWLASLICFLGILPIFNFQNILWNGREPFFILGAILFAILDIVNKKYIYKESMLSLIFYSSLFATLLTAIPLFRIFQIPDLFSIVIFFIFGATGNAILYLLLKAFQYTNLTLLAPFRYLELPISILASYYFFNELPTRNYYFSMMIIVLSTLYITMRRDSLS